MHKEISLYDQPASDIKLGSIPFVALWPEGWSQQNGLEFIHSLLTNISCIVCDHILVMVHSSEVDMFVS